MERLAHFLYEVGMLRRTPRSGYQFLGSGCESVAEHILATVYIGYVLARLDPKADEKTVIKLCLFHDLPEARTGDLNYVNKQYVAVDEAKAVRELTTPLFFGADIAETIDSFNEAGSRESLLARDADQLAMLLQLKEHGDLGNKYSEEWIAFVRRRLKTDSAVALAEAILNTDSSAWWFKDKAKDDWWVHGPRGGNGKDSCGDQAE